MALPLKIFLSYARKDAEYKDELLVHLSPLVRDKEIIVWHDNDTLPGEEFDLRIQNELEAADVVLFLISPNFMASEYIRKEIQQAIDRHPQGGIAIVPIWIKPLAIPYQRLDKFQSLPKDRKPVSQWRDHDEAWVDVVRQLHLLFNKLRGGRATENPTPSQNAPKKLSDTDKKELSNLIAKSETKVALDLLQRLAPEHGTILLLASRFNKLQKDEITGIISFGDASIERNKINASILSLLDEL